MLKKVPGETWESFLSDNSQTLFWLAMALAASALFMFVIMAVADFQRRRAAIIWARNPPHGYLRRLQYALREHRQLLGVFAVLVIGLGGIALFSPWPLTVTLRHLAAMPNCSAARTMGLAPSLRGQPGYWPWHDRDKDGKACEPYRKRY